MKTFKRICIEKKTFIEKKRAVTLERGEEYITSEEVDGEVTVFTTYWFKAPANLLAGKKVFTSE